VGSLDASMESLRRNPEMCPVVHGVYRRALIRRFPYAVFYEYAEARITVYAVLHASRGPQKTRERLP
jgi:plasmid stabilization system protein ParE